MKILTNIVVISILALYSTVSVAQGNDRALAANRSKPSQFFGEFSAGEQDKKGVLKYSYIDSFGSDFTALSIELSSPLDDNDVAQLASLDGLANTSSVELEYYRGTTGFDPRAYGNEMERRCAASGVPSLQCDTQRLATALGVNASDLDAEILSMTDAASFEYSFSAKSGSQKYDFFDTNHIKQSQRERSYSFTAQFGWRWLNSTLSVSTTREKSFTPEDDVTICSPLDMTLISCTTAPGMEPKELTGNIGRIEFRRWSGSYGYSVKLSHNDDTSVTGIEVPVYFVLEPSDKWGGGIKFGWRDDTRDFGASFFIGLGW